VSILDQRLQRKRRSLLFYWSIRYFLLLLAGVVVVGVAGVYLVQWGAHSAQIQGLKEVVREIGQVAAEHGGKLPEGPNLSRDLNELAEQQGLVNPPLLFIVDPSGHPVQFFPSQPSDDVMRMAANPQERWKEDVQIMRLNTSQGQAPLLAAVHPIASDNVFYGYVVYLAPEMNVVKLMQKFQWVRLGWLATMLLCGWAIIYMFTRRLLKPIRETADAARQVAAGNYHLHLSKSYQEKELHELMSSFKEMAERLRMLESLRTQLLAGVTHELKTPVTSISGLIQAVRDEVVSGEEARAFLDISLKECMRLQSMMEDLLDFNRFAGGSVQVVMETVDLQASVEEMVEKWRWGQGRDLVEVKISAPGGAPVDPVVTDPARLEQVIVNLLNNAAAATPGGGDILIRIVPGADGISIHIQDAGEGIPEDEQANVFEPFYRGRKKSSQVRGLGLGLPFSRMIARSLGGDLLLSESGPAGSVFTIILPNVSSGGRAPS